MRIKTENGEDVIKPNKGDAVFYPANYLHKVNKITKGQRKVILGWIDCFWPDPKDRFILKEGNELIHDLSEWYDKSKTKAEKRKIKKIFDRAEFLQSSMIRKCVDV